MLSKVEVKLVLLCEIGLEGRVEIIKFDDLRNGEASVEQQRVGVVVNGEILREALGWHICKHSFIQNRQISARKDAIIYSDVINNVD